MNNEVRETLAELCKDKRPDDYIFVSPKDSDQRLREVKKDFILPADLLLVMGYWRSLLSSHKQTPTN